MVNFLLQEKAPEGARPRKLAGDRNRPAAWMLIVVLVISRNCPILEGGIADRTQKLSPIWGFP